MSSEPNPPLASTRAELRNLRNNSQATVEELKAFLREMKGKSPQEMLGMVATNQLFKATLQSLVFILVLIAVFTVIPYFTRETPAETPAETVEAPAPEAAPAEPETVPETPPEPAALENLGIGEEKQAPPNVNPLDGNTGSFLDELE